MCGPGGTATAILDESLISIAAGVVVVIGLVSNRAFPPFALAQLVVLAIFGLLGVRALRRFRP